MPAKEKDDGEEGEKGKEETIHPLIIVLYVMIGIYLVSLVVFGFSWRIWQSRTDAAYKQRQQTGSAVSAVALSRNEFPTDVLNEFEIDKVKARFFEFAYRIITDKQAGIDRTHTTCMAQSNPEKKSLCSHILTLAIDDYNANNNQLKALTDAYFNAQLQ